MATPTHRIDPLHFVVVDDETSRHEEIARIAYSLAEGRGFEPGHDAKDWALAEAEFNRRQKPR